MTLFLYLLALALVVLPLPVYQVSLVSWFCWLLLLAEASCWPWINFEHRIPQTLTHLLSVKRSLVVLLFLADLAQGLGSDWSDLPDLFAIQRQVCGCRWDLTSFLISSCLLFSIDTRAFFLVEERFLLLHGVKSLDISVVWVWDTLRRWKISTTLNATPEPFLLQFNIVFNTAWAS